MDVKDTSAEAGDNGLERGVGEHGVVPPDREQLLHPVGGLAVLVDANAVYPVSATSASEIQQSS